MPFLDNRISNLLKNMNVKKLTNKPKLAILMFFVIVFALTLVVILQADNRTKEIVATTDLKVEETEEYDDKFVKNQADLFGYNKGEKSKSDKPKDLKDEEYIKIFKDDPSLSNQITADANASDLNADSIIDIDTNPEKTDAIFSELENNLDISANTPELPVLILYDKESNTFSVSGSNEKYPNNAISITASNLNEEEKQKINEALNSGILAVKKEKPTVETGTEPKTEYPSYQDQLKSAIELTKDDDEKPQDVLDENFTLHAKIKEAKKGEIKTGFIIPATLLTEIESGLKGMVVGQVRQNVFDTATGNSLLIPQGTKLIGDYQSDVKYGAKRIFVNWKRLVFPNGSSLDIGSMPGADMAGTSGFKDKYDSHFWKVFGNAILFSFVLAGVNITQSSDMINQYLPLVYRSSTSAISESMGQTIGETLSQIIQKNLNVAPDITIRTGYLFNIMITKDITLPEYQQ